MALYHLSVSHGSRAGGQSAAAKGDYVTRAGKYADRDGLVESVSANLPAWAEGDARAYWQAVDTHSRANARLFTEIEFALPRELSREAGWQVAQLFADELATKPQGHVPYSMALHDSGDGNPHVHLVLSSRIDDRHQRTPEQFFAQAASRRTRSDTVAGAPTWSRETDRDWLEAVRSRWGELANAALARAKVEQRIDHRSYARRGIDRVPTMHEGWAPRPRKTRRAMNDLARAANQALATAQAATRSARAELDQAKADLPAPPKAPQGSPGDLPLPPAYRQAPGLSGGLLGGLPPPPGHPDRQPEPEHRPRPRGPRMR